MDVLQASTVPVEGFVGGVIAALLTGQAGNVISARGSAVITPPSGQNHLLHTADIL
jgi:hypothetical protein